jgi:hypothetical protein
MKEAVWRDMTYALSFAIVVIQYEFILMLVLRLSVHSPVEAPSPDRYAAVIPAH